ncbi:hypothetical protein B0H63DRAFT_547398 [Podospora didyma]|uniref:Uncharacterized protein n=1 Tax=Podospora didyma TaxID=330526 RepID=A0AAE0NC12_9PEZI|nr:hypothetical protein B0H63DRAFT_547398 [Podospora didyma]
MRASYLLLATSAVFFFPSEAKILGPWKITNFYRSCGQGISCVYFFNLNEKYFGTPATGEGDYYCGIGGLNLTFFNITPINLDKDAITFFSFLDIDLQNSHSRGLNASSNAYEIETLTNGNTIDMGVVSHHIESMLPRRDKPNPLNTTRQIVGMSILSTQQETNSTGMWFDITSSDGSSNRCEICVPETLKTESFPDQWYDEDAGFSISWRYKPDTDSAVMTLCNNGMEATWFKFDNIGSYDKMYCGNLTEELVYYMACGAI